MKKIILIIAGVAFLTCTSSVSFAWGKRGHEIVAAVAAKLLAKKKNDTYLTPQEFDLGYYANVPDIIWKNISNDVYTIEGPQHFLDWNDMFAGIFGAPKDLPVDFKEYKSKMGGNYDRNLGLAPWRIHDLVTTCKALKDSLMKPGQTVPQLQTTQEKLLVCMGTMAHYTGDMSQPLHVTDNYDGNLSNPPQKGVHAYFENNVVDALDPDLKINVLKEALKQFDRIDAMGMNSDEAVRFLINDSHKYVDEVLKIDRKVGRTDMKLAKIGYRALITQRLAQGAIITALVWNEILADAGKVWNSSSFYLFDGKPDYVQPTYEGN